jgi:hypothetical protein
MQKVTSCVAENTKLRTDYECQLPNDISGYNRCSFWTLVQLHKYSICIKCIILNVKARGTKG